MSEERPSSDNRYRIDQAHAAGPSSLGRKDPRATTDAATTTPVSAMQVVQSVRNHASQLATHLQGMRQDVDRRESELNARIAKADTEMRSARLWLQERQEDLEARAEALDERERKVSQAEVSIENAVGHQKLATAEDVDLSEKVKVAVRQLQQQRHRQETELRRQQQQIELRRRASVALVQQLLQGIERRRQAVEDQYEHRQRQLRQLKQQSFEQDYQRALEHFSLREQHLDEADAILTDAQADLEIQREQLKNQRQRSEHQQRQVRTQLAERQRELESQWHGRQQVLARRGEHLDSREAALRLARHEVTALHREALELRLATQELWSKLTEAVAAPALATEFSRIRRRMSESFHMERNEASEAQQNLQATVKELAGQHSALKGEKQKLHDWIARRELEIEQQAARLVAREHELDRNENEQIELLKQWETDRRELQDRIRRLTKQIRRDRPPKPIVDAAA